MGYLPFERSLGRLIQKIMLGKVLVSFAAPSRYDRGIIAIKIDTNVEYSSPSYKRAY